MFYILLLPGIIIFMLLGTELIANKILGEK